MENIYQLTGKYADMNAEFDQLSAQLDEIYEANGGEVTECTQEIEGMMDELQMLKQNIIADIINNADSYAEIALNKKAQRSVLEAELKAVKEEQKKVQDRIQARINKVARSEAFWKECFDAAMKVADTRKIGGAKTNLMHSIYYATSETIEVDDSIALAPYQEIIDDLVACLPRWTKVEISSSKSELKKLAKTGELPKGSALITSERIEIR